jgi:ribosome modulation factor
MKSKGMLRMKKPMTRKERMLNPKESLCYKEGRAAFFMKDEEHNNPYGIGELRSRMEWLAGWYDAKVETQGFDDVNSTLRS